jgi:hypothetical protein
MTTIRENLEGQLAAARSAAERSRANGESDAAEQAQIGCLQGELDRLNKINEEARPAVEAMERREREAQDAAERAATQRQNRERRTAQEGVEAYRREQENQWLALGGDQASFDAAWPEIKRKHLSERLITDEERRAKVTPRPA